MANSVYLSGPSSNITDPLSQISADWKSYAASTFLKSGITVANPIDLDLSGFIEKIEALENTVRHSLGLIDRADSLLANLTFVTESTTMEMFHAHSQGKQVVVVGNEPFSPWVLFHSQANFTRLKDAVEFLVNQPGTLDTIAWSLQHESMLKRKSEQYPPEGIPDFEYYGGNLPVLVIAPHASNFFRDGNLFNSESYTGSLAVLMHKLTGCHALLSSYCLVADPVYYLNAPMVQFLCQLIKKVDIKMVIFLHGAEWNNPNDITITSWNNSSLKNKVEYLNLLTSMLKIKDFKDIGFDSKDLISNSTKSINHLIFEDFSIPTLRLEIHQRYRLPKLQPSLYLKLQTALAQFLLLIGVK